MEGRYSEVAQIKDLGPRTLCEKIIRDADLFHLGTNRRKERSRLLRKELANCGQTFSDAEWRRRDAAFVADHHFNLPWIGAANAENNVCSTRISDLHCQKSLVTYSNLVNVNKMN